MKRLFWWLSWLLCWAFGHTGDWTESGYHVCSRCGLHAYWSYRETSGEDVRPEYGNAGRLINWFYRWQDARRRARMYDDDLPF